MSRRGSARGDCRTSGGRMRWSCLLLRALLCEGLVHALAQASVVTCAPPTLLPSPLVLPPGIQPAPLSLGSCGRCLQNALFLPSAPGKGCGSTPRVFGGSLGRGRRRMRSCVLLGDALPRLEWASLSAERRRTYCCGRVVHRRGGARRLCQARRRGSPLTCRGRRPFAWLLLSRR